MFEFIADSGLHDYNVTAVNIDNDKAVVEIVMNAPSQNRVSLFIEDFTALDISHKEPWGKGTYIASADIQRTWDTNLLTLELNSGDHINIEFEVSAQTRLFHNFYAALLILI